jgi:hypothetical protein
MNVLTKIQIIKHNHAKYLPYMFWHLSPIFRESADKGSQVQVLEL